ncbi:hypothetical protein SALBM311S_10414 [Streptomyces alboniger]
MTSTDIALPPSRPLARQMETVTTRTGMRLSASAAKWFEESVPQSSRDARAWRWQEYAQWCSDVDWHTADLVLRGEQPLDWKRTAEMGKKEIEGIEGAPRPSNPAQDVPPPSGSRHGGISM